MNVCMRCFRPGSSRPCSAPPSISQRKQRSTHQLARPRNSIAAPLQNPLSFWRSPASPSASCATPLLRAKRFLLSQGGTLVLYTDGLTETPRPPHPIFTCGSLRRFLNASPGGSAFEISNRIMSALFFEPSIEMDDDLTLIVAKHTGERIDPSSDYEI